MEQFSTINTSYGIIKGIQKEGYQVFKGIRYATANRFERPVICHRAENDPYDATRFGYTCPQPGQPEGSFYFREFWHHLEYATEHREDCLFLNIWKPDHAENLPVAIWIHGGAFMNGFGSKVEIDGEYFNRQGIILVSINYRVGPLGFLTSNILENAFGYESGNYGIYDQLIAIDWVREHIADFGGNPEQITLMGQSSGAMSVQTLLGSPLLSRSVTGAVMHSGGGIENWMNVSVSHEQMLEWHEAFLKTQGLDTLEKLLAADPHQLAINAAKYTGEILGGKLMFIPHMSGDILPDTYENVVRGGGVPDIPYIIGVTKDDMTVQEGCVKESPVYQGCLKWAEALNALGRRPSYVYLFAHDLLDGEGQGAFHSGDLWYSFHTLDRSWRRKDVEDYRIADEMNARWAAFIQTGNPNVNEYEKWMPYQAEEDVYCIR